MRGQLIDGPGYMANYALAALIAAAVRARIREVRGAVVGGRPGLVRLRVRRAARAGASRAPADLLEPSSAGR